MLKMQGLAGLGGLNIMDIRKNEKTHKLTECPNVHIHNKNEVLSLTMPQVAGIKQRILSVTDLGLCPTTRGPHIQVLGQQCQNRLQYDAGRVS